ncbi:DNA alkylation repair enzyme [Rhizobium sp. CF080]|uniref:DNA alkylation repair protein n=1 Tax=Rhizobium sp. (strain CF080) TaxID=1144310 RepID=UPI0002718A36|nr:DNA alkylation repair protein [Rhizobium sp. CF080]EUB95751.1 DNA alkylation repair enzyme [Rhizobium sp. CF080]
MIGPSSDVAGIVVHLETLRSEENISGMARFGIVTDRAIGISNPDLQKIARTIKRNHGRALDLWRTGIREAHMLAIYTADPASLTPAEARGWAEDFASWEIVDTAADLFVETPFWQQLVADFAEDDREFIRRTAFAMIAGAAVHRKQEPNDTFIAYLSLIEAHSTDPRNFVKKAVNWALRNIGKRNRTCHAPALSLSEKLAASPDKTARWIGKDALKELSGETLLARLRG